MREIRIGISGWRYGGWRGTFYPKGLIQKKELEFASRQVNSIEINGTFYNLQKPAYFEKWYEQTPEDFVFSVKGNRYLTHIKLLTEIERPLANFFATGVLGLKEKLGPFLWQFPPRMKFNPERFELFLKTLPKTVGQGIKLSKKCDPPLKKNKFKTCAQKKQLRHAVEIRNESFMVPEFIKLLKKYNVAFVIADSAGKWPMTDQLTADLVYMRLHGAEELYSSGYDEKTLNMWAAKIKKWKRNHDIYVYFDNDVKVRAPFDAKTLGRKLKIYD
jgi:uncharacterized protein YecE (DUF72 family)